MKSISRIFISLVLCINLLGTGFLSYAENLDNEDFADDVYTTSDEPGFTASTDEDDDLWETIPTEDKDKVENKDNTDNKENVTSDDKKADDEQALIGNEDETLDDDPETSLNFSTFNLGSSGALDPALLGESKIVVPGKSTPTDADLLSSVTMTINGKNVTDIEALSLDDVITVNYQLKSPIGVNYSDEDIAADSEPAPVYVTKGEVFYFDTPNVGFDYSGISIPTLTCNGNDFATVEFEGGKIKLTIVDEEYEKNENAQFGFQFTLNKVADAYKNQSEIDLKIGDRDVLVKVSENQPKAPSLNKTGTYDNANDVINWTVNIDRDANAISYANGFKFVDTFAGEQVYVDGSFKVNDTAVTDGLNVSTSSIEYAVPAATTDSDIVIKYQTKPTADFMKDSFKDNTSGGKTIKFSNSAKILDDADKEIATDNATVPVTKEYNQWIKKEGGEIDLSTGRANWTVTIDTNNYGLKNLKLYDKFDTDNETTMELVSGSLSIDGPAGTLEGAGSGYDFCVSFGNVSNAGTIKVSYTTQIKEFEEFQKTNRKVPENKAWISYEDEDGTEVFTKNVGVGITGLSVKAGIHKEYTAYDSKTHQITWTVTANKNKMPITDITIKDVLPADQKLIEINNIKISDGTTLPDVTSFADPNEYSIVFDDKLNGNSVTFNVVSEIVDKNFWANNKSQAFSNKAEIYTGDKLLAQDTASKTLTSTVITKTSGSYNYDTHEIEYKIVVNENKMAMKSVTVTDELIKAGVELVDGSLKINGSAASGYTYKNGVLTIDLGDIAAGDDSKKTITFSVKVKDELILGLKNNESTQIKNEATVKFDDNAAGLSSNCTTPIKNVILSKKGKINPSTGLVDYTVYLNYGKQEIPAGTVLRDTLGASFEFISDSIHLYECTVDPSTGDLSATSTEVPSKVTVEKDGDKTRIDIKLTSGTNKACVLVYSASMEDKSLNDFTNDVKLIGFQENEDISSNCSFSASEFSSVNNSSSTRLVITKKDFEDGSLLPGATFQILDADKKVIAEVTTNSKGQARLVNKLVKGNTYYLRETKAPEGYQVNKDDIEVVFNKNSLEATVTNKKLEAEVKIDLQDTANKGLSGGTLEVTRNSDNKKITTENTDGTAKTTAVNYDVEYTLKETKTPTGYEHGDDVVFKVTKEGDKDVVKVKQDDTFVSLSDNTVIIKNVKKDSYELKINDLSDKQSEKLTGATLVVSKNADGSDPIATWNTDGTNKSVELNEGEYYIVQKDAPKGFIKADAMKIKIAKDGNKLKLFSWNGSSYTPVDSNLLSVVNKVDTSKKSGISVEGLGPDGNPLDGTKVTVSVLEGGLAGDPLATGIVPNDSTNGTANVNYQTKYIAVQDEVPEGYLKADPIIFKIDSDGNIWTLNADGSFTNTGSKKLVFKNKLIPKSNPSNGSSSNGGESGSGDGNGSGSGSDSQSSSGGATTTAANTNAQAVKKPIDMSALPDVLGEYLGDEDESGAPRLAKTAGFFGTVLSYAFGLIMLLFGMYLCFGKKNEKK
ncbi:Uncharacterized surface anchored protein [Butyrivibrio hungatei DSM 14810]|uniref:Uncharacterized surface anchored protein n=1 Tax=Butyrivibrio hungatei DSM 14810 TaxID=1121132 RepID=A0A1M7SLX0_9FIRM|nr:SpaA isopeptide-forming pilin-related protein [Butyrivibrio hungatei]SHN59463.1 Uncharacterized surface anchored protein [Butyrivibrio hungatei DSM 14810]